jgi:ATP-binding cassette subfamily B (MDR/TAP) protein 1
MMVRIPLNCRLCSNIILGTIAENVSLSIPPEDVTEAAIEEACKTAQIHDFITSLPDG